ncbi:hypothetical protein [Ketobacter sp.]|uniref:hypothetical protein n=1 Tax=Ketobacter sp. TaxID=2083498 RepID=UPI000F16441B|nr:hypothetical protein [Ketobacter sp.]RLT96975.1 MAG: hypothetical protein D9N14_13200 [Ketobacter sp.]
MAVGEGKFKLYTKITPPLEAGDWRFEASQNLSASTPQGSLDEDDLRIDQEQINVRIRSPRYVLPPDQVLSTYPPANSFGSYGSRLPQVVIKRRTLPWERRLDGAPQNTPWLALVLIAEGEARLDTAVDVADCVTPGVVLDGVAEVAKGNRLVVRKSIIDKVFPTRNDVDLLAHAREVDIHDTELMMGDDDGFLAVVISNRLPVPGKTRSGESVPVKYLACLVNLEGQYNALLERSPDPVFSTRFVTERLAFTEHAAQDDHRVMGTAGARQADFNLAEGAFAPAPLASTPAAGPASRAEAMTGSASFKVKSGVAAKDGATPHKATSQWSTQDLAKATSTDISLQMAADFRIVDMIDARLLDPEYRFPVLLHWSFTTTGNTTFRSLMENLDSRLLGDVGNTPSDLSGRLPLEVVESGHVGLNHKTREGDEVRSWYRGPLVPHPTLTSTANRLDLAHSSDQLRIVIPDGREDLSLATGFEIGRLLTLSQPSIIASLMRWRQGHYHAARLKSMLVANRPLWESILGAGFEFNDLHRLGPLVGRYLVDAIVKQPELLLGEPRPKVSPGRPLEFDGRAPDVLATGLGLSADILRGGDLNLMLDNLRKVQIPMDDLIIDQVGTIGVREALEADLNTQRIDLVSNVLSNKMLDDVLTGPAFPVTETIKLDVSLDALDRILVDSIRARQLDEDEL